MQFLLHGVYVSKKVEVLLLLSFDVELAFAVEKQIDSFLSIIVCSYICLHSFESQ